MAINRFQVRSRLPNADVFAAKRDRSACEVRGRAAGGALAGRFRPSRLWPVAVRTPCAQGCALEVAGRHHCSLISGTNVDSSKLPLSRWFLGLAACGVCSPNLAAPASIEIV